MQIEKVRALIEQDRQEFLEKWIRLASSEGTAREPEAMDRTCGLLQEIFESEGFKCRREKTGDNTPDVLIGTRGSGRSVLFSGHYDTVFREGEWKEHIHVAEGGKLKGPGVLDMKGGIIISLFTARILRRLGLGEIPLKVIFVGDEEIGHEGSDSAEILKNESEGALWAINLETGFENSDICIGRKGTATCIIDTRGVSAHPGNAFEAGKNAVLEMAHKVVEISRLTDSDKGTTVSAGRIEGGTAANVIPDSCRCAIDLRFSTMAEFELLKERISRICREPVIEGTKTEVDYAEILPPYETTSGVTNLFQRIKDTAARLGQGEIEGRIRGGASDAAYIGQMGVPVICAAGVRGGGSHSREEWAAVESLSERTALFTTLIAESNERS